MERTVDQGELRGRFPVASRMAEVARDVIAEETGLMMDDTELALAATYFQVFLEDHVARQHRPFNVAILTGQGPGTARLIRAQLSKLLPQDTIYSVLSLSSEPPQFAAVDLVVTTPGSQLRLDIPTIELSEVFDRGELIRKLSAMKFAHHGPLALSGESGSMLVSLLDDERFLQLPTDSTSATECPFSSNGSVVSAWSTTRSARLWPSARRSRRCRSTPRWRSPTQARTTSKASRARWV